jgi:hypothetical protein
MTSNKGMEPPLKRVKITDPKTHKDYEGSGIYTDVWEITLDSGKLLTLTDYEAELYRLVVL